MGVSSRRNVIVNGSRGRAWLKKIVGSRGMAVVVAGAVSVAVVAVAVAVAVAGAESAAETVAAKGFECRDERHCAT
jgi:hypothetical protein